MDEYTYCCGRGACPECWGRMVITELEGQIATLTAERDQARAEAAVLAGVLQALHREAAEAAGTCHQSDLTYVESRVLALAPPALANLPAATQAYAKEHELMWAVLVELKEMADQWSEDNSTVAACDFAKAIGEDFHKLQRAANG